MKRLNKILLTILIVFAIITPPVVTMYLGFFTEAQFDESFVGALDAKLERLNGIEGEKLVVVGGSSVAFGLDSRELEEYIGMPVVNFCLYAALGTKLMLDLSLSGIGEGDIVVVAPEMNRETLSLYFNADTAWKALEGDFSMLKYIDKADRPSMVGAFFGYVSAKMKTRSLGGLNLSESVYASANFNEYGDFRRDIRHFNVMPEYYDPNTEIVTSPDMLGDEFYAFADYLNEYVKKCESRGARVYFSFSPMNSLAVDEESAEFSELYDLFVDILECEVISIPEDYLLDPGYFYDTNFHLNNAGVGARTILLAGDIKLAEGITAGTLPTPPKPERLPIVDPIFDGYDENEKYFTYEIRKNGTYSITGLSELGKGEKELTIPLGYNGRKVFAVCEGAFADSSLCKLNVTEDSYLIIFEKGAFLGADKLESLVINKMDGYDITPPPNFLGVNADKFTVYVPKDSDFPHHYNWGERGLTYAFIE